MVKMKRCLTCGNPFTPKRSDARYCRAYCRLVAFRKRDELIVARAERDIRAILGHCSQGRITGSQAKAKLALLLMGKVHISREVKELIRNL